MLRPVAATYIDCVRALLAGGCDKELRNDEGLTAEEVAQLCRPAATLAIQ
jgi:hypothetical protein